MAKIKYGVKSDFYFWKNNYLIFGPRYPIVKCGHLYRWHVFPDQKQKKTLAFQFVIISQIEFIKMLTEGYQDNIHVISHVYKTTLLFHTNFKNYLILHYPKKNNNNTAVIFWLGLFPFIFWFTIFKVKLE